MYDLVFVEPGPLPPHERSWRHPSELGPTRLDVDDADRRGRTNFVALAGGTMAVLAVATMVVAMTPRAANGPVAMIATTTPISLRAVVGPPAATEPTPPDTAADTAAATAAATTADMPSESTPIRPRTTMLTSFSAFPHSITPGPQLDLDGTDVADEAPADDALVFLRTEAVTYLLPWDDARQMTVPDGSVIFDSEGDLVARVSAGELLSLVGDRAADE